MRVSHDFRPTVVVVALLTILACFGGAVMADLPGVETTQLDSVFEPGEERTIIILVTNTGSTTESYQATMHLSNPSWNAWLTRAVITELPPGETWPLWLTIEAPDVRSGAHTNVFITLRSSSMEANGLSRQVAFSLWVEEVEAPYYEIQGFPVAIIFTVLVVIAWSLRWRRDHNVDHP
jgi:hypothetical protein